MCKVDCSSTVDCCLQLYYSHCPGSNRFLLALSFYPIWTLSSLSWSPGIVSEVSYINYYPYLPLVYSCIRWSFDVILHVSRSVLTRGSWLHLWIVHLSCKLFVFSYFVLTTLLKDKLLLITSFFFLSLHFQHPRIASLYMRTKLFILWYHIHCYNPDGKDEKLKGS